MRTFFSIFISAAMALTIQSCSSAKKTNGNNNESEQQTKLQAGPPTIVYKTKKDYFDKVPVTLSDDKTAVVNYPAPKDLIFEGKPAYPTRLENGFLLDNRGINANVAFLKINYEDYAKLEVSPTLEELNGLILDNDPLEEMYYCGSRFNFKNLVDELNDKINENKLNEWKKLH